MDKAGVMSPGISPTNTTNITAHLQVSLIPRT